MPLSAQGEKQRPLLHSPFPLHQHRIENKLQIDESWNPEPLTERNTAFILGTMHWTIGEYGISIYCVNMLKLKVY